MVLLPGILALLAVMMDHPFKVSGRQLGLEEFDGVHTKTARCMNP